ncbi:hypothetical protein ElyMa_003278300 [Elysia marginata]|uniref:MARVEL domain-containing protein n=1 Tax=Elysia marginata TaxID=1093978 RepID=A0AAV4J9Q0_9GAST|nr:hypothetical protein ElyMa_003278300 [Elysia marginata]
MATCIKIKRFFTPDNSLRLLQMIIAIFLTSITFSWEDKGIKYSDLNAGDYDQGGTIVFFNFVAMLSLVFLGCVLFYCIIWSPKIISTRMDMLSSGGLSILMFIATAVLAHGISKLGKSVAVKEAGLHFGQLETAVVFGMILAMLLAVSVAFSVCHYRRNDHIMFRDSRSMTDLPDDIPT